MNTEPQACNSTPHETLIGRILDSRIPKNEEGWAARREIERLRAEVAQADADYNDAVTLAQMNLDLLKAVEAEVAALKAAGAQKDGALGICRAMLSVVHDVGQFTRSTKVAIGVAESALSTDAGKGWIDATGAVEAVAEACEWSNDPIRSRPTKARVMQGVPDDWAGSTVLIVRKP